MKEFLFAPMSAKDGIWILLFMFSILMLVTPTINLYREVKGFNREDFSNKTKAEIISIVLFAFFLIFITFVFLGSVVSVIINIVMNTLN